MPQHTRSWHGMPKFRYDKTHLIHKYLPCYTIIGVSRLSEWPSTTSEWPTLPRPFVPLCCLSTARYPYPDFMWKRVANEFCQAGIDDQFTFFCSPHGKGIAQLLRMRGFPSGRDHFENDLFGSLSATLILQSFTNPEVTLCSNEYVSLEEAFFRAAKALGNRDVRLWRLMAQISRLMAQSRDMRASELTLHVVAVEAEKLKHSVDVILAEMRCSYELLAIGSDGSSLGTAAHAVRQRALGIAMATKAILICAFSALLPKNSGLEAEATDLSQKALDIVEDARIYRPLGAVWTVHTLICMWCAVQDASQKAKIEVALLDYQRDAIGPSFRLRLEQLIFLRQRLRLQK